ncbi:MAG: c-type cytochrome biogenesis protein CcsB [Clostridiales bacterium]|nr:c-type cytochrome biogenesis protein CcsB [Clostridiales bacterium]
MGIEADLFLASECALLLSAVALIAAIFISKSKRRTDSPKAIRTAEQAARMLSLLCIALMTAFLIARTIRTGHGPFTSMYEFSAAFVWGILLMSIVFSWRYKNLVIHLSGFILSGCLLIYIGTLSPDAAPLVPALQNSLLLSAHVFAAVIAYGAFTIGFIASILYVIQKNDRFHALPTLSKLEDISYHSVVIGFPFMTLVIVLGAIWADIAWGTFWSWDPKETASLVTWLLYAGYLHTRLLKNWRGRKSAILLIVGFIAVIFTFFGNYLFGGLHSYA